MGKENMRNTILFIEWKSFGNEAIRLAFKRLGYLVENYELDTKKVDTRLDMEYTEKLAKTLMTKSYFCVFSFNYYPIIAIACKACKIPYVSWTYDSPFIQLFSPTLEYETNFAFVFDSSDIFSKKNFLGCSGKNNSKWKYFLFKNIWSMLKI